MSLKKRDLKKDLKDEIRDESNEESKRYHKKQRKGKPKTEEVIYKINSEEKISHWQEIINNGGEDMSKKEK